METPVYYERNLPHYQPPNASYLVNIRLAGSLPPKALQRIRTKYETYKTSIAGRRLTKKLIGEYRERQFQYFLDVDHLLDAAAQSPHWLQRPDVANIIVEALHYKDGTAYELLAYCIMPNHVHIVLNLGASTCGDTIHLDETVTPFPVTRLMASVKKCSARLANKLLGRKGPFWQHESYDHVIRNSDELERILWYVLNNPVAAGIASSWTEWKWTYCKPGLLV